MRRAVFVLSAMVLFCGVAPAEEVVLETGRYRLGLQENGGGLKLVDRTSGRTIVEDGNVWFRLHDQDGVCCEVGEQDGPRVRVERDAHWIALEWLTRSGQVTVELRLSDDDGLTMRMSVNQTSDRPIVRIDFPLAVVVDEQRYRELIAGDHIGVAIDMERWFGRGGSLGDGIPYPTAHADLLVAQGKDGGGSLAFFCPHVERLLVPSHIWFGHVGEHRGAFRHTFHTHIPADVTWHSPSIRVLPVADVFEALDRYRREIGLDRAPDLRAKLGDAFDRAARAVVMKYECDWHEKKAIREFTSMVGPLPSPLIIEPVSWWPSKFDDHYPDYFPINAELGTDDDFRKMIDDAHAMGHVVMPFVSPGHWSLGAPTTEKVGPQVASRGPDGEPYIYDGRPHYGVNYWATPWHPLVVEKAEEVLRRLKEFGCDAVFADIVGNSHKAWDFAPSCPNPRAHFGGMIRLGEAMARVLPMTTEGGDDLHSANFWGMFQFFLKVKYKFTGYLPWKSADGYDDRWKTMATEQQIRLFPYNSALASGLAMVYPHNLGPPIFEPEMLADSVAMGMGLYITFNDVKTDKRDWLEYLHHVQQEVVRHYFGRRMTGFEYVIDYDRVSRTSWPGLDLYVNHADQPVNLSVNGQTHELGSYEMLRVLNGETAVIPNFTRWLALRAATATQPGR
ncbi:MAG: hypothetical protein GXY33_09050 [Phycisphaerae bacterium]|nr:hypothetical protein [Phycisphaerae bacterium]